MKQKAFEKQNSDLWNKLESLLNSANNKKPTDREKQNAKNLPALYRQVCHHYSLSQHRHYSPALVERLHSLMLRSYRLIYKPRYSLLAVMGELLLKSFPQALQKNWKLFFIAFAIAYVPMFGMGIACYINPDLIYLVMEPGQVNELAYMYNPENEILGRNESQETASRVLMFGHYIQNNISIDFRIFAGGITFGFLTIVFLFYNGIVIGAVSGYLSSIGYTETFWSFVPGHSGFELNAMIIAGLAGFLLAKALIIPGQYTRKDALALAGKESSILIFGAGLMTLIAALIEAFWSPTTIVSVSSKVIIGLASWVILYWYFFAVGRPSKRKPQDA